MVLAESDSTWNQTLHVPTASSPRTGKEFMEGVMNLTDSERIELRRQATARNGRADAARRARLVLLLSTVVPGLRFARSSTAPTPTLIAGKRFESERLAGLFARHTGRQRYKGDGSAGRACACLDDQGQARGWFDPLVLAQARRGVGWRHLARDRDAHLGEAWREAPSPRGLHRFQCSRLLDLGR